MYFRDEYPSRFDIMLSIVMVTSLLGFLGYFAFVALMDESPKSAFVGIAMTLTLYALFSPVWFNVAATVSAHHIRPALVARMTSPLLALLHARGHLRAGEGGKIFLTEILTSKEPSLISFDYPFSREDAEIGAIFRHAFAATSLWPIRVLATKCPHLDEITIQIAPMSNHQILKLINDATDRPKGRSRMAAFLGNRHGR